MCVCFCDSECVVVLGAGAETLCGEHVLMSTAVQYPAIRFSSFHTQTHRMLISCKHSQVHHAQYAHGEW